MDTLNKHSQTSVYKTEMDEKKFKQYLRLSPNLIIETINEQAIKDKDTNQCKEKAGRTANEKQMYFQNKYIYKTVQVTVYSHMGMVLGKLCKGLGRLQGAEETIQGVGEDVYGTGKSV